MCVCKRERERLGSRMGSTVWAVGRGKNTARKGTTSPKRTGHKSPFNTNGYTRADLFVSSYITSKWWKQDINQDYNSGL